MELGRLAVASEGLSELAYRAVELLAIDANGNAYDVESIVAAGYDWILRLQERVSRFIDQIAISPSSNFTVARKNIVKAVGIEASANANRVELRARKVLNCETDRNYE